MLKIAEKERICGVPILNVLNFSVTINQIALVLTNQGNAALILNVVSTYLRSDNRAKNAIKLEYFLKKKNKNKLFLCDEMIKPVDAEVLRRYEVHSISFWSVLK